MVRRVALVLSLAVLAAPGARGENFELPAFKAGYLGLGLHLGMVLPTATNGFSERAGRGAAVSLRVTRFIADWIALGAELGGDLHLKHKSASTPGGSTNDASYEARALHASLLGRVNLFESRSWSPYVIGGVGLNKLSAKGAAPGAACWPLGQGCAASVSGASTGVELSGGVGLEFFIMRGMALSLEGRFREHRVDGKTLGAGAESLSASFGTTFWF
ncbi:MAG: outer membrane beta-barrel protein [Elusimicrobia bacterium]|nr:outer membrane beta-barrel protein [Elusimicrobiota bacterium]